MFITEPFLMTKTWKELQCSSRLDEQIVDSYSRIYINEKE